MRVVKSCDDAWLDFCALALPFEDLLDLVGVEDWEDMIAGIAIMQKSNGGRYGTEIGTNVRGLDGGGGGGCDLWCRGVLDPQSSFDVYWDICNLICGEMPNFVDD